jgi:hypothetical protein
MASMAPRSLEISALALVVAACAPPARSPDPLDGPPDARDIDVLDQLSNDDGPSPILDTSPIAGARFGGGDGTSQPRAIVITGARDVAAAENALIARAFGRVTFLAQQRIGHGKRTFDMITIMRGGGRRSTLWFDVSEAAP